MPQHARRSHAADTGTDDRNTFHADFTFNPRPSLRTRWGVLLEVPNDPAQGKDTQCQIRNIQLPPIKPLARTAGITVVVIMPAFTKGDQRQ